MNCPICRAHPVMTETPGTLDQTSLEGLPACVYTCECGTVITLPIPQPAKPHRASSLKFEETTQGILNRQQAQATTKSENVIRWITSHPNEVNQYVGKLIAVHPARGIVDSDADLHKLSERLRANGTIGEVVIDAVPSVFPAEGAA